MGTTLKRSMCSLITVIVDSTDCVTARDGTRHEDCRSAAVPRTLETDSHLRKGELKQGEHIQIND